MPWSIILKKPINAQLICIVFNLKDYYGATHVSIFAKLALGDCAVSFIFHGTGTTVMYRTHFHTNAKLCVVKYKYIHFKYWENYDLNVKEIGKTILIVYIRFVKLDFYE
jgi:hypothetical protein